MAANPNTISSGIQETWADVYQLVHYKQPVYRAFADFSLANKLKKGDTVHREYTSSLVVHDMAGDGGYQRQALTDTDETLVINKEKETSFYIKSLDEIQNHLPTRTKYATKAMNALFLQIDGDVLGNYDQATSTVDDSDLGGTSGNGITVTTANIDQVFTAALTKLQLQNVIFDPNAKFTGDVKRDRGMSMPIAVISPQIHAKLIQFLGGKDSALGDKVSTNGNAGTFMGFNLFVSNNLGWSGKLVLATQPTDGDTVTIHGVTFTFKTTLGTTAGNLLIGASAATACDALVAAVNDSESLSAANGGAGAGTAGTLYVEPTLANRNLLKNITATDGTSFVTFKATGKGHVVVSETLTAAADIWTAALQIQHLLFGVNNSISIVIQKTPEMLVKDRDGKVGKDIVTWTVYGIKVFNDQKPMLVDVKVRSDAFVGTPAVA